MKSSLLKVIVCAAIAAGLAGCNSQPPAPEGQVGGGAPTAPKAQQLPPTAR